MQRSANLEKVHVVEHPFVTDSLGHLRNKNTQLKKFRFHSDQICRFLFAEAIRGLEFEEEPIETPLTSTVVQKLSEEVVVLPVFRAGLAMMFGAMQLLPKSKIGFVGMERDEETAKAHEYYWKVPVITKQSVVIVTDPMLATGGTIVSVLQKLDMNRPKVVRVVSVVSAPEGVERVLKAFPEVEIFTAAVDSHLNEQKYIVPGLGDYGDRYFGTE